MMNLNLDLESAFQLFEKEDHDKDGKITSSQFTQGLRNYFLRTNFERQRELTNNFGREFLGRKKTRGSVSLDDVKKWLSSKEILKEFAYWKIVEEAGDEIPSHEFIIEKVSRLRIDSEAR